MYTKFVLSLLICNAYLLPSDYLSTKIGKLERLTIDCISKPTTSNWNRILKSVSDECRRMPTVDARAISKLYLGSKSFDVTSHPTVVYNHLLKDIERPL